MKVVLDTNILVSAFLFGKRLEKIIKLIEQGEITPCFVMFTLQEFKTVLSYEKFRLVLISANKTAQEIVQDISNYSEVLDDPQDIPKIVKHLGDNYILAAAAAAKARYIITGDTELLELKTFENIPIITPEKFLQLFTR